MENPRTLWAQYHTAVKLGNNKLAEAILRKLHTYQSIPRPQGCSSCSRRFL